MVRNAVAVAERLIPSLQVIVQHEAWAGDNVYAEPEYDEPVDRACVIDYKQRMVTTASGEEKLAQAKLTFTSDIVITVQDRLTIPGGGASTEETVTAPILNIEGTLDPLTNRPYATVVYIGA